ncbi:MAG TPA: sodium:calcium symporter, partial [Opitutus sp.]|nr:sodium:calcium symporter [Opitutus sp.]
VAIVVGRGGPAQEVLTNCVVNNVTNLTLVLALPVLAWGLQFKAASKSARGRSRKAGGKQGINEADTAQQLNRLSLLLTLAAVLFFTGVTWALAEDGRLDRRDGLVLVGLFLFWQCFQVFDVMKHNVRQRRSFGAAFYFDVGLVFAGGYALFVSIDWLVAWLAAQGGQWLNAGNLGWLSGWLMVLPNALLAFYYAAKGRADIAYASQVGDGHICIPLCVGLAALAQPMPVPAFFGTGLIVLGGVALAHVVCVACASGLPRWTGWGLAAADGWFVAAGFFGM